MSLQVQEKDHNSRSAMSNKASSSVIAACVSSGTQHDTYDKILTNRLILGA